MMEFGGWIVFADLNNNGVRDASEPQASTDGAGTFNLRVACRKLIMFRVARPAPWIASTDGETSQIRNGYQRKCNRQFLVRSFQLTLLLGSNGLT